MRLIICSMSVSESEASRKLPCSSAASRAELTPLPETSVTTTTRHSERAGAHRSSRRPLHATECSIPQPGTIRSEGNRRGRRLVWISRAIDEFLLHALLDALLFEQARVLENRRSFERKRLQQLAISGRQIDGRLPRVEVDHTDGVAAGRNDAGLLLPTRCARGPAEHQRCSRILVIGPAAEKTRRPADRSSSTAVRGVDAARSEYYPAGCPISVLRNRSPWRSRASCTASPPFSFSSRNPRSKPVMARAASTTAASTSSVESEFCSARATSTSARKFREIPGPGRSRFRSGELIEQFLDLVVVEREDQAVGIGKAELDPVGRIQLCRFTRVPLTNTPWLLFRSST